MEIINWAGDIGLYQSSILKIFSRMASRGLSFLRRAVLSSSLQASPSCRLSSFPSSRRLLNPKLSLICCSSLSMEESTSWTPLESQDSKSGRASKWKPMCLYYTQGRCTKLDDPLHLEKFSHSCSVGLGADGLGSRAQVLPQGFDYFLVLDLEGKIEILEFPVLLFDAKTLDVVDVFHRFVRPTRMSDKRISEYIEGKYGKFGVDRVWHDTAVKFADVIEQFESWLRKERDGYDKLWRENEDGCLHKAAFVTCGNWDLKTKIPQQCEVSGIRLPRYFMEWINLKDIFLNFYNRRAPGMLSMMRELGIPPVGSHHLGMDDSKNIARVLRHMLTDGAHLQITAKRAGSSTGSVRFLLQNRI